MFSNLLHIKLTNVEMDINAAMKSRLQLHHSHSNLNIYVLFIYTFFYLLNK